jgi:hypothetical protein
MIDGFGIKASMRRVLAYALTLKRIDVCRVAARGGSVVADEHHGTKELASAIRAGASRRPEQAFGDYFVGRRASCALGAAYEGMYRLAADMSGQRPTKDLTSFFDCLEGTIRSCPVEGCKKRLLLAAMIVHLNDHHSWSREKIADWLEENGAKNGAAKPAPADQPR